METVYLYTRQHENSWYELKKKGRMTNKRLYVELHMRDVAPFSKGRPDDEDRADLASFAKKIKDKIARGHRRACPQVPGQYSDKRYRHTGGHVPAAADSCIECGLCAERCPVAAIPSDNYHISDPDKCLACRRCIVICPFGARSMDKTMRRDVFEKISAAMEIRIAN